MRPFRHLPLHPRAWRETGAVALLTRIRRWPWPWIGTVGRVVLGVVWIVAGALKVGDLTASGRAVVAYRLLPPSSATALGTVLPFVEIALGVLLVLGLALRLSAIVSAVLLVAYIIGIASVLGVLSWNAGNKIVGVTNGVLFINFVPVTVFAIRIAQGHRFQAIEFVGAALVIGALIANNVVARQAAAPKRARDKGNKLSPALTAPCDS